MTDDKRPSDVPETIGGRYRVLGELGRGNMGRVLKVSHLHTGEALAMKVLFVHRGESTAVIERFRREARSLGQVRSDHVVRVIDADIASELDGAPYIVTELLDGEDLARYAHRRGRLAPAEVVRLIHEVALGLARVHQAGLVHRDLKPGNIFLHRQPGQLEQMVVKLLDFGLVKSTSSSADEDLVVTQAGQIIGTPLFMSPEQVTGPNEAIGAATDIWSVGILAFHLLTGRAYWNLREMPRGVFDIGVAPIRPPSSIDPTLSVAFDAWFLRSCARNTAARWPDPLTQSQALARALGQTIAGAQTMAASRPLTALLAEIAPGVHVDASGASHRTAVSESGSSAGSSRQRRQVTVLSYRLVHTGEAASMDPEEFEVLEHRVHTALDETLGDLPRADSQFARGGRLVFFGYPVAYGSDTRRAVEAALRLVATVAEWSARELAAGRGGLQVRVGVHTGVVLTRPSNDVPNAAQVVGPALSVATDLEHDAELGQVLVSEATWRLVASRFIGRRVAEGRVAVFGVAASAGPAATETAVMVGRHLELGLLLQCLDSARSGESQMVLASGEVGIGKSRLLQALRESPEAAGVEWLECQCSPYFQNTPFHPLVRLIRMLFAKALGHDLPGTLDPADNVALSDALGLDEGSVHSLASLASLSGADPSGIARLSPLMRRERTIHAVVSLLHHRAAATPVILVVEDLHWADPSTLELLDELAVLRSAPLLSIMTARPDFTPSWRSPGRVTPIQLRRLARGEVSRLIAAAADRPLSPELAVLVERSTGGVPLFIEELTRLLSQGDAADVDEVVRSGAVPTTLREALSARLDRLGPARALAERAAVIGTEFTADDLLAIGAEAGVGAHIQELVRANVLQAHGLPPRTTYSFAHALLRDAAYSFLPGEARRAIHLRAARLWSEKAGARPEVVAHHFAEAGQAEEAVRLWLEAGHAALGRSANAEARGHFERALDLLGASSSSVVADPTVVITLRTLHGMAWVVSRGYAVPEAEADFADAMERVRALGDAETPALAPALWAQWLFSQVRGRPVEALEQSRRLLRLAERSGDVGIGMLAHLAEGTTLFGVGRFDEALAHLDAGIAAYDPAAHAPYRFIYGQDPWMLGMVFKAWLLWCTGHPDTAMRLVTSAVEHAERLKHPNSSGFALAIASMVHHYRGDADALARSARALMTLSIEQGWIHWLGHGRLWTAAAQVLRGEVEEGVVGLREARAFAQQAGERSGSVHYEAVFIDGLLRAGRLDEAAARVAAARDGFYELAFEPELLQLEGEIARQGGDIAGARHLVLDAFASAERRGSLSHQLRAALALARLGGSDVDDDRERLERVLAAFDEGFDTADLVAARSCLANRSDRHG